MDILIVDPDARFARRLEKKLLGLGRQSHRFDCCERAREPALQGDYKLLIVGVENAGDQASRFIERFQRAKNTPVIVMSANAAIDTKIHYLNQGAVDYVVKPVDFEEFLARVDVQLRKSLTVAEFSSKLVFDDLTIHLSDGSVERGGKIIALTRQEFALLLYLARHQGQPMRREQLFEHVWGRTDLQANLVNVAVRRLRAKIDAGFARKFLHTVHGTGYVAEYRD